MLIVVNGPFKSGSTLLYQWLHRLFEIKTLQNAVYSPHLKDNLAIVADPKQIEIATSSNLVYIAKLHCYNHEFLTHLSRHPNCYIFTSQRSLKDCILSHYHHFSCEKIRIPFYLYLILVSPIKLVEIIVCQYYSQKFSNLVIRFEDMKNKNIGKLQRSLSSLGFYFDSHTLQESLHNSLYNKSNTSNSKFENLQKTGKRGEWFYSRKNKLYPHYLLFYLDLQINLLSFLLSFKLVLSIAGFCFELFGKRAAYRKSSQAIYVSC